MSCPSTSAKRHRAADARAANLAAKGAGGAGYGLTLTSVAGTSSVTLFHGDGMQGIRALAARTPEALCRSLAAALWSVCHPKVAGWAGAILVLGPTTMVFCAMRAGTATDSKPRYGGR